jgi:hypothetical protein
MLENSNTPLSYIKEHTLNYKVYSDKILFV